LKPSRAWLIWAALGVCAVLVLGAMALLTRNVRASQQERAAAEARAELEEQTRLSLWRLDAAGAAILLRENQRPPADYGVSPKTLSAPLGGDPAVKLHFEIGAGGLRSPEVDSANESFNSLKALLSNDGDIAALIRRAESAWNALPKDATVLKIQNAAVSKTGPSQRYSPTYQEGQNRIEKALRAKVVDVQAESAATLNAYANEAAPADSEAGGISEIGSMRPAWIGGELFLLRQLTVSNSRVIQGVWLDAAAIRKQLLGEISDLLPTARLTDLTTSSADPLALVSLPFLLQRDETLRLAPARWSEPLMVGWAAVICALAAVALLVRGVMRLSERRASFVSAVTHELRTPLTTFRLYSDMLESGAVKEEKRGDYLRVLSREADRLSHLVENVLAFSRIERGSARSNVRVADAGELLERTRERLEARLATAGLTLEMDTSAALRFRADTAAVEHILFNLIDNAAKYAASGDPPSVIVETRSAGRQVEVIVRDHGPGIPPSERARIFRAFHKSAHEAAESQPGVGLGLALSRRLAREQGGDLRWAESEKGACFILSLPGA
jgi:signal transduction histidine kinase